MDSSKAVADVPALATCAPVCASTATHAEERRIQEEVPSYRAVALVTHACSWMFDLQLSISIAVNMQ